MKTEAGKILTRLVIVCAVTLFIMPLTVSAMTVDEVLKNDAQYKSLNAQHDSLTKSLEARKAQLIKQYNCDPSGACKGDLAEQKKKECLEKCDDTRVHCVEAADKRCHALKDPRQNQSCHMSTNMSCANQHRNCDLTCTNTQKTSTMNTCFSSCDKQKSACLSAAYTACGKMADPKQKSACMSSRNQSCSYSHANCDSRCKPKMPLIKYKLKPAALRR